MKQAMILCLILAVFIFSSKETRAAEDKTLENVFKNAYYGAAIGGLLGTAIMIFSDRPADHFNYIAYGLAGGVIAGTFYSMAYPSSRSFSDFDQGKVKMSFPYPEIQWNPRIDPTERRKAFLFLPVMRYHY